MRQTISISIAIALLLGFSNDCNAQKRGKKRADRQTNEWRYEVEATEKMGVNGTYQIKVWSYSRHPDTAKEWSKKNGVHAILFKGYMANGENTSQPPLMPMLKEEEHKEFFESFFQEGGDFLRFVSLANQGSVGVGDMIQTGKKEWKVGVIVSVDKTNLRKYMEQNKIIQSLGGMF